MGNVQRPEYDSTDTPTLQEPNWMSKLNDKTSIADLCILGTHNSVGFFGGDSVQTQSWALDKQLRAGIRALDIHVRHSVDDLLVYYGPAFQQISYNDVENICIDFLRENPSEFVLVNVQKQEEDVEPHSRTFYNELKYRADQKSMYYWRANSMPTVGQVRGRIVLLGNMAYGIPSQFIISCGDVGTAPTLFQLQSVWGQQKLHLAKKVPKNILRNTSVTSSSAGVYPYSAARNLNEWFMGELALFEMPLGIVWFDFPGNMLVNKIIGLNKI